MSYRPTSARESRTAGERVHDLMLEVAQLRRERGEAVSRLRAPDARMKRASSAQSWDSESTLSTTPPSPTGDPFGASFACCGWREDKDAPEKGSDAACSVQ